MLIRLVGFVMREVRDSDCTRAGSCDSEKIGNGPSNECESLEVSGLSELEVVKDARKQFKWELTWILNF